MLTVMTMICVCLGRDVRRAWVTHSHPQSILWPKNFIYIAINLVATKSASFCLNLQLRVSNLGCSIFERGPCGVSTASHHTRIFFPADLHTGSLNSRESLSTRITISGAVQQTRSQRSIAGDNWQVRSVSRRSFSPSSRRRGCWHKADAGVLRYV